MDKERYNKQPKIERRIIKGKLGELLKNNDKNIFNNIFNFLKLLDLKLQIKNKADKHLSTVNEFFDDLFEFFDKQLEEINANNVSRILQNYLSNAYNENSQQKQSSINLTKNEAFTISLAVKGILENNKKLSDRDKVILQAVRDKFDVSGYRITDEE